MWYFNKLFFIPCDTFKLFYTMWYFQTILYHVISSNCSYHVIPSTNFFISCDTFNLFHTMSCIQTVLYHVIPSNWCSHVIYLNCLYDVIPSNCFIPCDTFKLFYIMWYLQTVVCHVIYLNCFIRCETSWYNTVWMHHMV
jgi:hypothetical protein